jgi:hypothetical protein
MLLYRLSAHDIRLALRPAGSGLATRRAVDLTSCGSNATDLSGAITTWLIEP